MRNERLRVISEASGWKLIYIGINLVGPISGAIDMRTWIEERQGERGRGVDLVDQR